MRMLGAVAVLAFVSVGCTTVRVVQREDCWVRRTSGFLRGTTEEIGPCAKPKPEWAEDRVTRVVQECVARADWQWHTRALAAWNGREPLPAQEPEAKILETCFQESARVLAAENESEFLRQRLAEVADDREALQQQTEADRTQLRASNEKLAEHLGEAATRPLPPAVATATASSDSQGTGGGAESASAPAPVHVTTTSAPGPAPLTAATPVPAASVPSLPVCEPEPKQVPQRQGRATPRKARAPAACVPAPAWDPKKPTAATEATDPTPTAATDPKLTAPAESTVDPAFP